MSRFLKLNHLALVSLCVISFLLGCAAFTQYGKIEKRARSIEGQR